MIELQCAKERLKLFGRQFRSTMIFFNGAPPLPRSLVSSSRSERASPLRGADLEFERQQHAA